jgi:hypothetical protein
VGPALSWAAHGHVQVFFSFSFLFFEIGRGSCVRRARARRKKKCFERGWGRNENLFISKQQFDNSSIVDDE